MNYHVVICSSNTVSHKYLFHYFNWSWMYNNKGNYLLDSGKHSRTPIILLYFFILLDFDFSLTTNYQKKKKRKTRKTFISYRG